MKKITSFLTILILTIYTWGIEIPFNPFTGDIQEDLLESKPTIGKEYFSYESALLFYDYNISYVIGKSIDQNNENYIFFHKNSLDIDVFSYFVKELLDQYLKDALFFYTDFNEDEYGTIRKTIKVFIPGSKPISIYMNISIEDGLIGIGISEVKEEVFIKEEFDNKMRNYIPDFVNRVRDKKYFNFGDMKQDSMYVDLSKYTLKKDYLINKSDYGIKYLGVGDTGFSKYFFIKIENKPIRIDIENAQIAKNLYLKIDNFFIRTKDVLNEFEIKPEEHFPEYVFIEVGGIGEFDEKNIIRVKIITE